MLVSYPVSCPYCGETFEANIDLSAGSQSYIEDCYVCCRPVCFFIELDHNGDLTAVNVQRDDE